MAPDEFTSLDVSLYELRLRARQKASLPSFLGSTLRGAFGHALKQSVCVVSHRDCSRCIVADRCVYPYIFETPAPPDVAMLRGQHQAPHPFILTPPVLPVSRDNESHDSNLRTRLEPGDTLTFRLVLMGRAIEYLPYVVYTVSEMARRGLGADRAQFDLSDVSLIADDGAGRVVYSEESQRISIPADARRSLSRVVGSRLARLSGRDNLKLRFMTPTRIRVDGDLQASLSFELFTRTLLRRVSLLAAVHGRAPLDIDHRALIERASEVTTRAARLRWWDYERYSNRQRTKMKLGGFVGEIEYEGEAIKELLPLIAAGETLHIGAGTSFGLGKFEMVM